MLGIVLVIDKRKIDPCDFYSLEAGGGWRWLGGDGEEAMDKSFVIFLYLNVHGKER